MAKKTINNGDTGLVSRTAINENFTELYEEDITIAGKKTFSDNLKVNAQAHGGDTLESFSASKTFDANDGNVFEMDVTASTTIGITNEEAGTYIFRLKIDTATPPTITVGASLGTKLPNASLDFDDTD